jgi:dsRNA-specific ribonuclease
MANSKTLLFTYCQEHRLQPPVYSTERAEGTVGYASSVFVHDTSYDSQAAHSSMKLAEEDAARIAYNSLRRAAESARSRRTSSRSAASYGYNYQYYDTGEPASALAADRTGPAERPANGTSNRNVSPAADYSRKLEQLCNARGLPVPEFDVRESPEGKFSATVAVGDDEYLSGGDSESFAQAKDYASLVALAEVGLSLLNINEREDGTEENLERSLPVFSGNDVRSPPPSANSTRTHATPLQQQPQKLPEGNYKAIVNEYCQKNYQELPQYTTEYPDDATGYVSELSVCGKVYRSKPMPSKKKAEQDAAGRAALDMGLVSIDTSDGCGAGNSRENRSLSPVNRSVGAGIASRSANGESSSASSQSSWVGGATGGPPSFSAGTAAVPENITSNYRGMLQEFLVKRGFGNPQYSTGQGGGGKFVSTVTLTDLSGEVLHFHGRGYANKKTAEQSAAKQACIHYNLGL